MPLLPPRLPRAFSVPAAGAGDASRRPPPTPTAHRARPRRPAWPAVGPAAVPSACLDPCLKCFLEDVAFEVGFVFLKKKISRCERVLGAASAFLWNCCHQRGMSVPPAPSPACSLPLPFQRRVSLEPLAPSVAPPSPGPSEPETRLSRRRTRRAGRPEFAAGACVVQAQRRGVDGTRLPLRGAATWLRDGVRAPAGGSAASVAGAGAVGGPRRPVRGGPDRSPGVACR